MTEKEMKYAIDLAQDIADDHRNRAMIIGPGAAPKLARALLAAAEQLAKMRAVVDAVEHDIEIVEQHRNARLHGGQHVGTGGPLSAANPSMLSYLRRLVRDFRANDRAREAKGRE